MYLHRPDAADTDVALEGFLPRQSGQYGENWSSLIGIVTAIVGNVLISFALNMQRYAHIRLDREFQQKRSPPSNIEAQNETAQNGTDETDETAPLLGSQPRKHTLPNPDKQQSYLTSPYWWAGIVLMTVGEAGNFLAYGFAPASIVSPLGVVALISNCIIAPFMLKERFRWRDAAGVVVAVGGAVTVVLSASDNNPKLGPDEIWGLIKRWEFETYLGVTVGVIAVLMWGSNRYGEKNILIDLGLVGLFGGYTALSTKGVASLLSYTLWRAITFPVFYLLLAILIGTAVMQIKYINRALQRFSATQVIPVQFVMFTLSVILGSAILYRDFERTSGDHAGKFVGGCAMTFLGVWLITSGRPSPDDDEEETQYQGDDTSSDQDDTSRRSSTIRAASPTRPETPIIKLTPDPTALTTLIENPWAADLSSAKPSIARHTSVPVLPSEAAPAHASHHESPTPPRTPTRQPSEPTLPSTPQTATPGLRRLRTADRRVGPLLASPLSTSLTAVVQDLKRGRARSRDPAERRGSALGIISSSAHGCRDGHGALLGAAWQPSWGSAGEGDGLDAPFEPLGRARTQGDAGVSASSAGAARVTGRGRSLSGTLGGLWRGIRGSASREELGGDV